VENKNIFALDIGTRKIVGLLMEKNARGFRVMAAEMLEHSTRAMLDGQIHDVESVADTISRIKESLEETLQTKFSSAAVAAAGRALKTACGRAARHRTVLGAMTRDEVLALEIEAVQQAQFQLAQEDTRDQERNLYFCVGYSVVCYWLENQVIGSLVGQVGSEVAVEVIATFLPRVVVDSLLSSLHRAGLQVSSLTLEPIAALSVAISPGMRHLNLALVDIGAGTSDIAVIRDGNIFAYAMVPLGGDELSEVIAGRYLLDFQVAEKVKRSLSESETISATDILGNQVTLQVPDVLKVLEEKVSHIAGQIAENILALNQVAPDAVICVGGGSLTPTLLESLANKLELPANRVGIRTPQAFEGIEYEAPFLNGPQGVTPLGIAFHYFATPPIPFIEIYVNNRETVLWNSGELSVANALLSAGISLTEVYGKPGMGKTIEINGQVKVFRGKVGTPPTIKVNGESASLESLLKEGDQVEFFPGENGESVDIRLSDLVQTRSGHVYVNGELLELIPVVYINGRPCTSDEEIPDRARIEYRALNSLENILIQAGLDEEWLKEREYRFTVDGEAQSIRWSGLEVRVDGKPASPQDLVDFGADINYSLGRLRPRLGEVLKDLEGLELTVQVNGEMVSVKGKGALVKLNGEPAELADELPEGASITLDRSAGSAILSDIFQVVEIKPPLNARLLMKVNGQPAGFTTPICNNCNIELIWES